MAHMAMALRRSILHFEGSLPLELTLGLLQEFKLKFQLKIPWLWATFTFFPLLLQLFFWIFFFGSISISFRFDFISLYPYSCSDLSYPIRYSAVYVAFSNSNLNFGGNAIRMEFEFHGPKPNVLLTSISHIEAQSKTHYEGSSRGFKVVKKRKRTKI